MADTKISALPAAASAADANEFAINEAGTSKKVTAAQVKTLVNTAPLFAAGSAAAGSWPKLTNGTVLTTPEAGAIEMDGTNIYAATEAQNRGYVPVRHFIRADAIRALPNDTNLNPIFNSPANGRLTLGAGVYLFEGIIYVTAMSATSGNALINLLGAGTATTSAWLWHAIGIDSTTPTNAAAQAGSFATSAASVASIVTAATGTAFGVRIRGTFEVSASGTLIPSIQLVTAAACNVAAGSYLLLERLGTDAVVSVGRWD